MAFRRETRRRGLLLAPAASRSAGATSARAPRVAHREHERRARAPPLASARRARAAACEKPRLLRARARPRDRGGRASHANARAADLGEGAPAAHDEAARRRAEASRSRTARDLRSALDDPGPARARASPLTRPDVHHRRVAQANGMSIASPRRRSLPGPPSPVRVCGKSFSIGSSVSDSASTSRSAPASRSPSRAAAARLRGPQALQRSIAGAPRGAVRLALEAPHRQQLETAAAAARAPRRGREATLLEGTPGAVSDSYAPMSPPPRSRPPGRPGSVRGTSSPQNVSSAWPFSVERVARHDLPLVQAS